MNIATTNQRDSQRSSRMTPIFLRFLWKEFRMIRGLWAAVAIMGLLVQCAERMLLPFSTDRALTLIYTALSAAVLYAVGAAATTFSVEHEEETYDLLTRLPTTWWPPFAAKLLVGVLSSMLLAAVLSFPALLLGGSHSITAQDVRTALGLMGFAIIEAIAWGSLFSLLIKRPLLAAIVTLVVGTVAVNVIVSNSSHNVAAALSPEAYLHALPLRLAIVIVVFAVSVLTARRWLTSGIRSVGAVRVPLKDRFAHVLAIIFSHRRARDAVTVRARRRSMLVRLLWQTWRESWKLLFVPLGLAGLLLFIARIASALIRWDDEITKFFLSETPLLVPALYGAMTFYPDQRRGSYRFLAEHAARPRYTWLARQIVWLGAFVVAWLLAIGALAALAWHREEFNSRRMFEYYLEWGAHPSLSSVIYNFAHDADRAMQILFAASFGALIAYGLGQLLSMAIRSEILAAFLALLLAPVVGAWVYAVYLWQLSPVQFLLPLFVGMMLATWLRAPDWIAGHNTWRTWLKPTIAVIAPFVLIAATLPAARLAQVRPTISQDPKYNARRAEHDRAFAEQVASFQARDTTDARQTADMYIRLAEQQTGTDRDLLAPWKKYLENSTSSYFFDEDVDETKLPTDQQKAFKEALQRKRELFKQESAIAISKAIEISKRPTCRFHFDPASLAAAPLNVPNERLVGLAANRTYEKVSQLISVVAGEDVSTPDDPARRFLAALKMEQHLRSGQPSVVVIASLEAENRILQRIAQWSLKAGRTKTELRDLLEKLTVQLHVPESPADALIADYMLIGDVIDGKNTPFVLTPPAPNTSGSAVVPTVLPHVYLAYLANKLRWERERAHMALERITRTNIGELNQLIERLSSNNPQQVGIGTLRHYLRPWYNGLPETWEVRNPAAVTSYLVSLEYKARVPIAELSRAYCDSVTCRRGTLLQIALTLYRLDHKKYPAQLADLVPEYLDHLPLDPYARQPFHYEPTGLNHRLSYWSLNGQRVRLQPNTPFLWSVGAGDVRLKLEIDDRFYGEPQEHLAAGEEPKPNPIEPAYWFYNEGEVSWDNKNSLFPLSE
jgi:hypothetical protein